MWALKSSRGPELFGGSGRTRGHGVPRPRRPGKPALPNRPGPSGGAPAFKPCFGPNEVETRVLEERIRRRILRRFVRMGAMPAETAAEMLYYCARPAIVLKRLEY